jgi:lysyl-tRNA synthetase class 1
MFWADTLRRDIGEKFQKKIASGQPLVIRDEKTASGRVHIGSLRGVAIHGLISEILSEHGINNTYLFEVNDSDPMDDIPPALDQDTFRPYLGKPLYAIPSPDGKALNFARYYADEFKGVIKELGFTPEFYYASDLYSSGKFNETIRIALEHAADIRRIYKEVSGGERPADWLPINIICEQCGKVSTTVATDFDGQTVQYACKDVTFTTGCGHSGRVSPFDGRAKLPWKVEWAAKFKVLGVDIEGGGKDHSTRGGSRQVADAISREVFGYPPPFNIPYEFFNIAGKKMSSSKGRGSSSREIADILPPELLRLLLLQKEPQRVIEFDPEGDTVPLLYDTYDSFAEKYFSEAGTSAELSDYARTFFLMHSPRQRPALKKHFLPRFSQIAYLIQMPHVSVVAETEKEKGVPLTAEDAAEIESRQTYARRWLDVYAPEEYKFVIQDHLPEAAGSFSPEQKKALAVIAEYIAESKKAGQKLDGLAIHTKLHDIKNEIGINPKDFFSALYLSILGRPSGPKAGWFLSVLDPDFVVKRLSEASA